MLAEELEIEEIVIEAITEKGVVLDLVLVEEYPVEEIVMVATDGYTKADVMK